MRVEFMNGETAGFYPSDEALLTPDVSDEALEAAAGATKDTAMTLPGGVSVNVMCCGGD
jgi:hypothetical protein